MKKTLLLLLLFAPLCRAQESKCSAGTPPITVGGVTVSACYGNAGTSATMSNETLSGSVASGYPFLVSTYFCEPGACLSCTSTKTGTSYVLVCTSTTCTGGPLCTIIYSATIQNNVNYMNAWQYCPALASASAIYGVCSSTSATYTAASNCGFISGYITVFSAGGCTATGAGCFDVGNNASGTAATSMSVTLPSLNYSNELVCALGGTINDEILTASSGTTMFPGDSGAARQGTP